MRNPPPYRGPNLPDAFDLGQFARYMPRLVKILILAAAGLWLLSGVYMVGPGERGVVLTFGRYSGLSDSGLHYRIPAPVQRHYIVDVARVRTAEVGYISDGNATRTVPEEALMLTGDENIVAVQLFVQYLVQDPVAYLFQVRNAEDVLKASAEIALRATVGQNTIDFTMTEGRVEAQTQVKDLLQELLDDYQTGLLVTEARLLAVDPPAEVRDAFHDVVRAFEDRERLVQEAEGYAEQVVPAARGQSAQVILEAEGYREQRLIRAEGDAARFLALLEEYQRVPDVMRERLYLESIESVLSQSTNFILDTTGSGVLPFLPLVNETSSPPAGPQEPAPQPTPQPEAEAEDQSP